MGGWVRTPQRHREDIPDLVVQCLQKTGGQSEGEFLLLLTNTQELPRDQDNTETKLENENRRRSRRIQRRQQNNNSVPVQKALGGADRRGSSANAAGGGVEGAKTGL